jgi:hypothetical protein
MPRGSWAAAAVGVIALLALGPPALRAQSPANPVYISEVVADPSDRLFRYGADGSQRLGHGPGWWTEAYDDSHWRSGAGPFGIGQPDQATDLAADYARDPAIAATYLRTRFDVSPGQLAAAEPLALVGNIKDGAVVFLNGVEVARSAMGSPRAHSYWDTPAHLAVQAGFEQTLVLAGARELLRPTGNLLAIQFVTRNADADGNRFVPGAMRLALALRSGATEILPVTARWRYIVPGYEPSGGVLDPLVPASVAASFSDWIELHNAGATEADLGGWALTDDRTRPQKWVIPAGTRIPAGGYLVVLADSLSPARGRHLHTNFGFSSGGEFAGLARPDGSFASAFDFPRQTPFTSYGWSAADAGYRYFEEATPGAANAPAAGSAIAADPSFSLRQGFYQGVVSLAISAEPGTTIRYTLDGSEPEPGNSQVYAGPLTLVQSTTVRARAFGGGRVPSRVATQTYLVNVPLALRTLPAVTLTADPVTGLHGAHGVLAVSGGVYDPNPLSPQAQFWRPTSAASVSNLNQRGRNFERGAHLGYIDPATGTNLSFPAGTRVAGSNQTRLLLRDLLEGDWSYVWTNTPSFNVYARSAYGQRSFDFEFFPGWVNRSFTKLRLNSIKDPFNHDSLNDALVLRMFQDIGATTVRDRFATLWVNGEFKGYYRLMETYTEEFFKGAVDPGASWDIVDTREVEAGSSAALDALLAWVRNNDQSVPANYQRTAELLDLDAFIDYLSINLWAANRDWLTNNFVVARPQRAGAKLRVYSWDAEKSFAPQFANVDMVALRIRNPQLAGFGIVDIARILIEQSAEFRQRFIDRQPQLFGPGGPLRFERIRQRLDELGAQAGAVANLMYSPAQTVSRYDTQFSWRPLPLQERREFINGRDGAYFASLKTHGLWSDAPSLLATPAPGRYDDWIDVDFNESGLWSTPTPGFRIYYTLDGSDPRGPGGAIAGALYERSIPLRASATVKARSLLGGAWGPLHTASYDVQARGRIVISQLHYNPQASSPARARALQFVELTNLARAPAPLAGARLEGDVVFALAGPALQSGQSVLVAADPVTFASAYSGAVAQGPWSGRLGADGGVVVLRDAAGAILSRVAYDDAGGWPTAADGQGSSLVLADPDRLASEPITDLSQPALWRASYGYGGEGGAWGFSPRVRIASARFISRFSPPDASPSFDDDLGTVVWVRTGEAIEYTLQQEVLLTDLEFAFQSSFCYSGCAPRFDVQVSRDGQAWTSLVEGQQASAIWAWPPIRERIDVPDAMARHVRIVSRGSGIAQMIRIAEAGFWSN